MVGKNCVVAVWMLLYVSMIYADVQFQINYSSDMPHALSDTRVESMVSEALDLDDDEYFEARVLVTAAHFDVVALRSDRYSAELFRLFVEDTVVNRVSEELYDDFFEESKEFDSDDSACPAETYNCPDPDVQVLLSAIMEFPDAYQNARAARDALQNAGVNVVYLEGREEAKTTILNYLSCPNLVMWGRIGHGDERGAVHLDDGSSVSARDLNSARVQDRVFPFNCCFVGNSSLSTAFMNGGATYMAAGNNVPLYVGTSEPAWRGFVVSTVNERMDLETAWQNKQNASSQDDWALNIKDGGPHYIDLDGEDMVELTITAENGMVTTDPEGTRFEEGTVVELLAEPEYGYKFSSWSGDASGQDNPVHITMDEDKMVTAGFEEATTYSLNISSENGSVLVVPDHDRFVEGEEVTLHAAADMGYVFSEWNGDITGGDNSVTLTMDSDKDVRAAFTEHSYTAMSQADLSVESFSSEDLWGDGRPAANVLDGSIDNAWFTHWEDPAEVHPHEIVLAIDSAAAIGGLQYTPRQDSENGRIAKYELYVSSDGSNWGEPAVTGMWDNSAEVQEAAFMPAETDVKYIRLVALSEVNGESWASIANLDVLHDPSVSSVDHSSAISPAVFQEGRLTLNSSEDITVRFSSVTGRIVKTMNVRGPHTLSVQTLDFSPGVYILQVVNSRGAQILTRQILVP
ncbi:MAG: InlB B-repeat-containing protein [Fibrobacterota bacterium]